MVESFAGVATTTPEGSESVKSSALASVTLPELPMVKVSVLTPPAGMVPGEKLFENPGRPGSTVRSALAVPPDPGEPSCVKVSSPEVFMWMPTVLLVTLT